jgi:hypothetical protein
MALQTSGAISLDDIHVEVGGTTSTEASINDTDIIGMIGKTAGTAMSFNEWYGASSGYAPSGLGASFTSSISSGASGPWGSAYYHPDANNRFTSVSLYAFNENAARSVTIDADTSSSISVTGKSKSSSGGNGDIIAVDGKHVLSSCHDGTIVCRDASNSGTVLWQKTVSSMSSVSANNINHASANGDAYQKSKGKDFDHVSRESGIHSPGTFFTGFKTSSGWYAVALNSATGAIRYSFLLASGYRGQWMDYDSTHVQLCAHTSGGVFYNILVNKSTGATSSQVKGASGKAQLRGFRTSYGAWMYMQHQRDHGGKGLGGAFGIRNSSGGVVGGCSHHNFINGHPRGIITPTGRIVTISGNGALFNFCNRASFAVWSQSGTPTASYCRDFRLTDGNGTIGAKSFTNELKNLPDDYVAVTTQSVANSNYTLRIGIGEFDCSSAPTSGTYGDLYLKTFTLSFAAPATSGTDLPGGKLGPPGTGGGNSTSFLTAELGSSNPSSNSDSIFTASSPTLTNDTGSLVSRSMTLSSKANTSGW